MALVREITLRNFRNFEEKTITFDSSDVIFTGKNGVGKSNLLEAIGFLSTLRSFRRSPVKDMITIGKESFTLSADVEHRSRVINLAVAEHLAGTRQLFINNAP